VPGIKEEPDQRLDDQIETLRRHPASAARSALNAQQTWVAILGRDDGKTLWADYDTVTNGEPDKHKQRRHVAAELGYCSIHAPVADTYGRGLAVPRAGYLTEQVA